jgi:uncharacterized membrane protein
MKKRGKSENKIKLNKLEKEIKHLEATEKNIAKEEKKIEKQEEKIEKEIIKLGKLTFQRKHFLELIRGTAGAFLGVGLGMTLMNTKNLAMNLPWTNVFGILFFILIISSLLIYKNEKDFIKKEGKKVIFKRLFFLYFIALIVELIALWLFGAVPDSLELLIKMLIIGSYSAMAGAVSFSII